jgi:hypothetical protein
MPTFAIFEQWEPKLRFSSGDNESFTQYVFKHWTTGAAVMFIRIVNHYVQCIIFGSFVKSTQAFCVVNLKNVLLKCTANFLKKYKTMFSKVVFIFAKPECS